MPVPPAPAVPTAAKPPADARALRRPVADDPQLEGPRRFALALLPVFLIALVVYLFRP